MSLVTRIVKTQDGWRIWWEVWHECQKGHLDVSRFEEEVEAKCHAANCACGICNHRLQLGYR